MTVTFHLLCHIWVFLSHLSAPCPFSTLCPEQYFQKVGQNISVSCLKYFKVSSFALGIETEFHNITYKAPFGVAIAETQTCPKLLCAQAPFRPLMLHFTFSPQGFANLSTLFFTHVTCNISSSSDWCSVYTVNMILKFATRSNPYTLSQHCVLTPLFFMSFILGIPHQRQSPPQNCKLYKVWDHIRFQHCVPSC